MARYEVDTGGLRSARQTVRGDPAALHGLADVVSAAGAGAKESVGPSTPLAGELDRFRLVHARLLDAVADAFAALGGALDVAAADSREVELAAAAALGR
ncbi:MAG: hypothetical protein JWP82_1221, partial [Humibacillus sp.]|nr:hypothetical protein [Humibacillus sp.]